MLVAAHLLQNRITPEKFKQLMLDLSQDGDNEAAHGYMDSLMCDVLIQLGYGEGVEIYKNYERWYG